MNELSKNNAKKLGSQTLLFQTQEECGELIKAIGKFNRTNGIGQKTEISILRAYEDMIHEIADVEICLEQLKFLLSIERKVEIEKMKALDKVAERYKDE